MISINRQRNTVDVSRIIFYSCVLRRDNIYLSQRFPLTAFEKAERPWHMVY